jgi:ABC-2 type transport system ATP-binding protein
MIRVVHVSKRFGATLAIDDVSFGVARGEVVGFLGPNGAGKSTLLRMLSTWLAPDSGTIELAGHDVRRAAQAARTALGYLPEHNALWESMGVRDLLAFVGRLRGLTRERLRERTAWVVERAGIAAVLDQRVQQCSKGFRQRVGLAAALIHDPPVLLLDEPTHGLDPLQTEAFLAFVRELAGDPAQGRAILFSSHVLAEVAALADRALVLQRGRLIHDGPLSELRARADAQRTSLEGALLSIVRSSA